MGLDLCFQLINASFTNEIFGQLLSNYNHYAANLNMKAVSFFLLTLYTNSNYFGMHCKLTEIFSAKITQAVLIRELKHSNSDLWHMIKG